MASTYDDEISINEIEGDSEEEEEDEVETAEPLHHARRPMNAFLIFCKRQRAVVKERFPQLENRAVTKILGEWWANLEECEKSCYTDLAKQYREAFLKANPGFKWYKLPAPPLRPISNRLKLLTDLNSHQGSITPGKLADESQLGGLSSLLVPYNKMSVSTSLTVQNVPKPPKKRYLEENAASDDPNQVFDDIVKHSEETSICDENITSEKILEVEPFAKLRNYSVSVKENNFKVKNELESDESFNSKSRSPQPLLPTENVLVISDYNNSSNNNSNLCSVDEKLSEVKYEDTEEKLAESNVLPSDEIVPNSTTVSSDNIGYSHVKWKTKFEKIKSRHLNYNNNNNELVDSKCSNYECSLTQDCSIDKFSNGQINIPEDSSLSNLPKVVKTENMLSDINSAAELRDIGNNHYSKLAKISQTTSPESHQSIEPRTKASKLNKKNNIIYYHSNKLPDTKAANKYLSKTVPKIPNESNTNFMRRNKSIRACKGVRYQEFMSSNQLGRKRRRKMNSLQESGYEVNLENEDVSGCHLGQIESDETKSMKDEEKNEEMEVDSGIFNIHESLDQNENSLVVSSNNLALYKSVHVKKVKHGRASKRRKSFSIQKCLNTPENMVDEVEIDKKCNGSNFNLEEKIEALPTLSLEEFQEKKRARNKKHNYLDSNIRPESLSETDFSHFENSLSSLNEFDASPVKKQKVSEKSSNVEQPRYFIPDLPFKRELVKNEFDAPLRNELEMKTDKKLGLTLSVTVGNSKLTNKVNFPPNSEENGMNMKSSTSGANNILVGSQKRKARRQKITHLEPGSKQKDTAVIEVDVLNDMGLATLAEVAALSKKESII